MNQQPQHFNGHGGQPEQSRIATPTGWLPIGDLRVGATVLTRDGQAEVRALSRSTANVAHVSFNDGTAILCGTGQLWIVQSPDRRSRSYPPRLLCLEAISGSLPGSVRNLRHFVEQPQPTAFPNRDLPLDPYLLGALIGDGGISQHQAYFATADMEMVDRLRACVPNGVVRRQRARYWWNLADEGHGRINPVLTGLRQLELLGHRAGTKFIPAIYKTASVTDRIKLLQGLMDTDGSGDLRKPPTFTTVSSALACDFQELVQSLCGIAPIYPREGTVLPQYRLSLRLPRSIEPFALTRKRDMYIQKLTRPLRMGRAIESIELIGCQAVVRAVVGSVDHTYLSDNFTVFLDAFDDLKCSQSKYKSTAGSCRHDVRRTSLS